MQQFDLIEKLDYFIDIFHGLPHSSIIKLETSFIGSDEVKVVTKPTAHQIDSVNHLIRDLRNRNSNLKKLTVVTVEMTYLIMPEWFIFAIYPTALNNGSTVKASGNLWCEGLLNEVAKAHVALRNKLLNDEMLVVQFSEIAKNIESALIDEIRANPFDDLFQIDLFDKCILNGDHQFMCGMFKGIIKPTQGLVESDEIVKSAMANVQAVRAVPMYNLTLGQALDIAIGGNGLSFREDGSNKIYAIYTKDQTVLSDYLKLNGQIYAMSNKQIGIPNANQRHSQY